MCTHALSGLFHNAKLRIVSPVFKWASSEWRFVQAWAGVSRGGKFMGVTHQSLSLFLVSRTLGLYNQQTCCQIKGVLGSV